MITLFTTTKDFIGQNAINQINAIRSWLNAPVPVQIVIFGRSQGVDFFSNIHQVTIIEDVKISPTGLPLINSMFAAASSLSTYPICCFANADILLTERFFTDISNIHSKLKSNYLIVGQRIDVHVASHIVFDKGWEKRFNHTYRNEMVVHEPYGSDFFVFPKDQYSETSLPKLVVGRVAWDNYMLYDARMKRIKLVDLSKSTMVIHQNHDYAHKSIDLVIRKSEEDHNYQFFPSVEDAYASILEICSYFYCNKKINKNYHGNNFDKYYLHAMQFDGVDFFARLGIKLEVKFLRYYQRFTRLFKLA
jgi:hypothetical protein